MQKKCTRCKFSTRSRLSNNTQSQKKAGSDLLVRYISYDCEIFEKIFLTMDKEIKSYSLLCLQNVYRNIFPMNHWNLYHIGGSKGRAPPPGPKFLNFHSVFGKNWKIVFGAHTLNSATVSYYYVLIFFYSGDKKSWILAKKRSTLDDEWLLTQLAINIILTKSDLSPQILKVNECA